jgi:hypothetical protein
MIMRVLLLSSTSSTLSGLVSDDTTPGNLVAGEDGNGADAVGPLGVALAVSDAVGALCSNCRRTHDARHAHHRTRTL